MGLDNHIIRNVIGGVFHHLTWVREGNNIRVKVIKLDQIIGQINSNQIMGLINSNKGMGLTKPNQGIQ